MKYRILITGANGFIGRHLTEALLSHGHQVVCGVRKLPAYQHYRCRYIIMDYTRDFSPEAWQERLAGIDIVINTVGIVRETRTNNAGFCEQTFDALHVKAPKALFKACELAEIKMVVQFSALGADENAASRYHISKKQADDFLRTLDVPSVILQPSLIFGMDGASTGLFSSLASMPVVALPNGGRQMVQPVHIRDVEALVVALCEKRASGFAAITPAIQNSPLETISPEQLSPSQQPISTLTIPVVGPQPLSLADYLNALRKGMGLGHARIFTLPGKLVDRVAAFGTRYGRGPMDSEMLQMLQRGNTGDPAAMMALMESRLISPADFIARSESETLRSMSLLTWLLPILRFSIGFVWIYTGIVSLGVYPKADSLLLLNRVGIQGELATLMLYGAGIMDLLLGVLTIALSRRQLLWMLQIALIVFYTAVICWKMPEFLVHPFGPLIKNIPMVAAIWVLMKLER